MIRSLKVWKIWISVLALVPLLAVACGGGEEEPTAAPPKTMEKLTGTVEIDGSSTVYPITEAVAEEFGKVHPEVRVNVGVSGTGGGFKRFVVGETDISDASRPIKDSEARAAADNGIEYLEIKVGTDGLSVMVNPENDFVDCLSVGELKRIWEPGSTVRTWNHVSPFFPNRPLALYGPDTDSGTFDYFTEEIVGEAQASRWDYTASADDNVLVQGISGDRNALGYFGYAYYQENTNKLKVLAIDDGDGCVAPTSDTIESGDYTPLARPLFIYVSKESMERPEVAAFVDFYMEHGRALTREVGYIPLAPEAYSIEGGMQKVPEKIPAKMTMEKLTGTIEIDGSSTVYPITEAVAEEFGKVHSDVRVNVGVSGTGGGFKRFVVGETDISDASRPIKDSEAQSAADKGVEYIEIKVGTDGLSVMVNPENDFVDCLSVAELKKIWEPGSSVTNWNQVRDSFPDRPLRLYGPDTDSGTFDYFTEEIVGEAQASRSDYTASADDNVLVQGISGDRNALGYFGYAYYQENTDKLRVVAIDDGEGCVTPTSDTIESGDYTPLARPLFIYVSKKSFEQPEVAAFVEFYMEHGRELTREVGYIPLEASAYTNALEMISR